MDSVQISTPDGPLHALRSGDGGGPVVLAAHGITASAMSFAAVARALPAGWTLLALDLRGRGRSNGLPGPYGMDRHADDLARAARQVGRPVVLAGQSMGAYAALRAAAREPGLYTRLVLIDGGLPLPVPAGADPDAVLEATLGPAITRLRMTFPTEDAYVDVFRHHPALAADWSDDLDAYARYDATGEPGEIRSRVAPDAVAADGRDLIVGAATSGDDLRGLRLPADLLYAPRGMFGQEPGMLPQPLVEHWTAQTALRAELVPDCNHYTILTDPAAAAAIVRVLTS
ncbi:alpha/beta hydrolase [Dactylosporangium sp. NPDC005555]|uniref:alpha/beta fold hydrolase n=1 Tax=Dactylosporangium sp. NPDC005555 TaxID=3154889 RepID=UPI0033BCB95A